MRRGVREPQVGPAVEPGQPSPLLSIVTVTFNDSEGLRRTLASVIDQTGVKSDDLEVVIVDGESDDFPAAWLETLTVDGVYISEPDRSVYDAMNKGVNLAAGKYLLFLNSGDVLYDVGVLSEVIDRLRSASPSWLVGRGMRPSSGGDLVLIENVPHKWLRHAFGLQSHCHQSTFFSKELLNSLGGYSEEFSFAGDFDLFLRCGLVSKPSTISTVVCLYEGGGMSEQRIAEIPMLQSKIRADRFQYPELLRKADGAYARLRSAYLRLRRWRHRQFR